MIDPLRGLATPSVPAHAVAARALSVAGGEAVAADRVQRNGAADLLRAAAATVHHTFAGNGVRLDATTAEAAAIRNGDHQIDVVDGATLAFPSQDLTKIESTQPLEHGQTHGLTKHVGQTLDDNIRRLEAQPHIRAAGGYYDLAHAQRATDRTIANPANQAAIRKFLDDPSRSKLVLARVDLGEAVGASTSREDLDAGHPSLIPGTTATVVLIKDPSFPEGYRVLTTFPDLRGPEVQRNGTTS